MGQIDCSIHKRQHLGFVSPEISDNVENRILLSDIHEVIFVVGNVELPMLMDKKTLLKLNIYNLEEVEVSDKNTDILEFIGKADPVCIVCYNEYKSMLNGI